jgi:hypothetical protein
VGQLAAPLSSSNTSRVLKLLVVWLPQHSKFVGAPINLGYDPSATSAIRLKVRVLIDLEDA